MKTYVTENFVDGYVFLEGPRWHDGRLWTSDIFAKRVYGIKPDGRAEVAAEVPGRPSGIGFMPDGTPLIVSMHDRCIYKLHNSSLDLHADLSALAAADINDMVVDDEGRAYVGSMGYDFFGGEEPKPGDIIMVEADGASTVAATGLEFPNGLLIADNGKTLVAAESFGGRLSAFDRAADGSLSRRRIYAKFDQVVPDGICLDIDGNIWVAGATSGEFVHVDHSGQVIGIIDVKPEMAIACQLGGDDGRTLYCLVYKGGIKEITDGTPGARIAAVRVQSPAAGSP